MRRREWSASASGTVCERLRADGRGDAADTVLRDWESFVSFYDFTGRALGASADD